MDCDIGIDGTGPSPSHRASCTLCPGPIIGMKPTGMSDRSRNTASSHAVTVCVRLRVIKLMKWPILDFGRLEVNR